MSNNPIVSVIVATYHRDEPLYKALVSIANQTYSALEVIVVDDNANEEWNNRIIEIVRRIQTIYPSISIQYICNVDNQGSAETRNIGIKVAKGEYISFLDDDDLYLPQKIEKQLIDMIDSGADYGLTDLDLYNQHGKLIDRRTRDYIKETDKDSLLRYHLMYHLTGTDTLMFRTEYLKRIGMFPRINVGDEFYLMEQAVLGGGKICYSPHCFVKAFVHEGEEEGLSIGDSKIRGENALYEEKKRHFSDLKAKDIRYIRTRHHLVLAFAFLRRKAWCSFLKHCLMAVFISPLATLKIYRSTK